MATHIIDRAASVRNETVWFWRDSAHNALGSKIVDASDATEIGKLCGFTRKWCDEIETIDFAHWLSTLCPSKFDRSECYVALKMDIEGLELEVLEALSAKGELCAIDEVHIEWHRPNERKRRRRRRAMIEALRECGLTLRYVTFPIDEVALEDIRSFSDLTFFERFEDCAWNNSANGKSVRVSWCDEHYYKMLTRTLTRTAAESADKL